MSDNSVNLVHVRVRQRIHDVLLISKPLTKILRRDSVDSVRESLEHTTIFRSW